MRDILAQRVQPRFARISVRLMDSASMERPVFAMPDLLVLIAATGCASTTVRTMETATTASAFATRVSSAPGVIRESVRVIATEMACVVTAPVYARQDGKETDAQRAITRRPFIVRCIVPTNARISVCTYKRHLVSQRAASAISHAHGVASRRVRITERSRWMHGLRRWLPRIWHRRRDES